jgi:guanylate kinase
MIKRSKTIEFSYQDENGEEHTVMLEGIGARCVQHEIDHLNGILFIQRASRLKLERALKARTKEKKKRIEYERRIALAKYFQEMQTAKDVEKPISSGTMPEDNTVSQES